MKIPWYLMAKGKGVGGYKTESGPIVSVSDALAAPLRSLVANIDPVQDLHGYDNPWPAGGGKNKFDPSTVTFKKWHLDSNSFATVPDSSSLVSVSVYGEEITITSSVAYYGVGFNIDAADADRVFSVPSSIGGAVQFWSAYADGATRISTGSTSCAIPANTPGFIAFRHDVTGAVTTKAQIESGSTVSAWTPYSNICPISGWSAVNVWVKPTYDPTADPTATLQLGQTVYGGTLDVTNGVLTVDRAMVDLGTLSWSYSQAAENVMRFLATNSGMKAVPVSEAADWKCSEYKIVSANDTWFGRSIGIADNGSSQLAVYDSAYTDAAAFTAAMSGVQLVYELATPITIPFTPQEISTLQGQNNVWADSGDVTVEYLASGGANADLMKLAVAFMGRE